MYTIEAMLLLLGVLSGFVMGIIVIGGLGLYRSHSPHNEISMATLDKLLLSLSLLATFALGVFICFVFR